MKQFRLFYCNEILILLLRRKTAKPHKGTSNRVRTLSISLMVSYLVHRIGERLANVEKGSIKRDIMA